MPTPILRARCDPQLRAELGPMQPLRFAAASPELDVAAHVRAGSAVRRWGGRIVITQDDVNALALLDERSGTLESLLLPRAEDGRRSFGEATGNKALKLDLEACVTVCSGPEVPNHWGGRLIAIGSGSTAARERLVVVSSEHAVRVIDGRSLYAMLRAELEFAGSELNIEGAVVVGEALRLFQRGNGAARGELRPIDATGDLELAQLLAWLDGGALPRLERVRQYELGRVHGVRLGFCDAAALPDGSVAFVAGAEDSPDTYSDGVVVGCRFGILDGDDVRTADIVDADGEPSRLKLEGLELRSQSDGGWEFDVVADMDDPAIPTRMGTLRVTVLS